MNIYNCPPTMSWKEPKVEPSPGFFPVHEAEIKRKPDLKDLYLAVTSLAHHQPGQDVTSSQEPISAILGKFSTRDFTAVLSPPVVTRTD